MDSQATEDDGLAAALAELRDRTPNHDESGSPRPGGRAKEESGEQVQLDLVERTMKEVAAQRNMDFAMLARLDRLRTQVRQTLRGSPKGGRA